MDRFSGEKSATAMRIFIGMLLGCIACFTAYTMGEKRGEHVYMRETHETYRSNLVGNKRALRSGQIRTMDFLLARYYFLANRIPENMLGPAYDFGPVNFSGLTIGSSDTSPFHEYQIFTNRHLFYEKQPSE
jgi:hypothetical protein